MKVNIWFPLAENARINVKSTPVIAPLCWLVTALKRRLTILERKGLLIGEVAPTAVALQVVA